MTSAFDEWSASLGAAGSPEAMPLLRRVFDEHGPVSAERVQAIFHDQQLEWARNAVRLVGHDITATTDQEAPPFEYRDEDDWVRLAYWGQYATLPIAGLTQAEMTVEIADFMQDEVMKDVRGVWPECRRHRAGLQPALDVGEAAWLCRVGGHVIAAIGELT